MSQLKLSVEEQFNDFFKKCWGHIELNSQQANTIKQTWFCAYLNCISLINIITHEDLPNDVKEKLLSDLYQEAYTWVSKDVADMLARHKEMN